MTGKLRIFCSYSVKDERFREELETHLSVLKRAGVVDFWTFRQIAPGKEWQREIQAGFDQANVFLALVSANFLASDYCWDIEMQAALERHRSGTAIVVPVILKPCAWKDAPFAQLQALPAGAKPVSHWRSHDDAWTNVVQELRSRLTQTPSSSPNAVVAVPRTTEQPTDSSRAVAVRRRG